MNRINNILLIITLLFIWSCNPKNHESLKIGVIIPLTGESAYWGKNIKNGVDLATKEINADGGVLGKKIELIYEDTKGLPATGVTVINKLINIDNVDLLIGDVISSVILAVAPIAEKNKIPLMGFGESVEISNAGDYIFRNWNSAASDIEITSKLASKFSKNIVIISQDDAFGKSANELIVRYLTTQSINISANFEFNKGASDFRTILAKLEGINYDGLYIACFHQSALNFLKQYKEFKLKNVNIYGVSSWEENTLIDFINSNFPDMVYYGYPLPPDTTSMVFKNFYYKYTDEYGKNPEILSDNGYDAVFTFKKAIEHTNSFESDSIINSLYNIEILGAGGKMSFDLNGDVKKPFGIKKITDKGFTWLNY